MINIFFLVALLKNCLRREKKRQTVVWGRFRVKRRVLNMALLMSIG